MKKYLFHILFFIIVAGDLLGEFFRIKWMDYTFKPLIMIWIGMYFLFFVQKTHRKFIILTLFAFLFSWLGDILLMFGDSKFEFFVFGLLSFLVAQIVYIILFRKTIALSGNIGYLKKKSFWILFYIAYGLTIYLFLFSHLNGILKIAVFVYMLALLGMSVMALNRLGNCSTSSFILVFVGSLFFVFSDTFIAINKFLLPVPYEGLIVMSTYISAQYLIMRGLLKQFL